MREMEEDIRDIIESRIYCSVSYMFVLLSGPGPVYA